MVDGRKQFGAEPENVSIADVTASEPATVLDYQAKAERDKRAKRAPLLTASYRSVLALAMPSVIESVFNLAIGFTDTWVAGNGLDRSHNAAASAAVGTMTYLGWFAGLMTSALGIGATAIIARSIGARRPRVANRVAGTALTAAFLVGLLVAGLLYFFASPVVRACALQGQAAIYAMQYLRIMTITICLQTAGMIGMACLRGAGDTFRPMLITGSIAVINIFTVPTLAYGWFGFPVMGIRGNALGTMIAFAICGVATLVLLLSGMGGLRLRAHHFRIVPHILQRILRIGLPSWAEGMLLWGGQCLTVILIINKNDFALARAFGVLPDIISGTTLSAHTDVLRLESFAFLPGFGFGIAASALVGQFLGAGQPQAARHAAHIANRLAFVFMTIAAIPMVFFPSVLLAWVVKDPHVVEIGRWPLIYAGLAQPGFAIAIIMGSGLKGAGETFAPMLSTIGGMVLVRLPILLLLAWYIFPRTGHPAWGLTAVWIGIFCDLNARAIYNGYIFRRGKWQLKKV